MEITVGQQEARPTECEAGQHRHQHHWCPPPTAFEIDRARDQRHALPACSQVKSDHSPVDGSLRGLSPAPTPQVKE